MECHAYFEASQEQEVGSDHDVPCHAMSYHACRTHVCFVPVECVTFVRFNRYQIQSLYDPLETFGEIAEIEIEMELY